MTLFTCRQFNLFFEFKISNISKAWIRSVSGLLINDQFQIVHVSGAKSALSDVDANVFPLFDLKGVGVRNLKFCRKMKKIILKGQHVES